LAELLLAGLIWPVGLMAATGWFLWRNGGTVRSRCGASHAKQLAEQLRAYFSAGILPPWYYMFELHDGPAGARSYVNRFETKRGIYPLLARKLRSHSSLNDKVAFEARCRQHQLRAVTVIATIDRGRVTYIGGDRLPADDLFVKPIRGSGGQGTECWHHAEGRYTGAVAGPFERQELLRHLAARSHARRLLVQPRIRNCPELSDINNGALSTLRIVTCLDERGRPEVVAGAMRMAIGDNHRVDNFHAGGIAAAVDLESGELGSASDLGMNARLGWVDRHPNSNARIRGRIAPGWKQARDLAERAHRAFHDRAIIGWDIAPTEDGPTIVEGNGAPDLDIIQRTERSGLAESRLSQLLAHHLAAVPPRI
jgi:hypothetical protein